MFSGGSINIEKYLGYFERIIDIILKLFGLGGASNNTTTTTAAPETTAPVVTPSTPDAPVAPQTFESVPPIVQWSYHGWISAFPEGPYRMNTCRNCRNDQS